MNERTSPARTERSLRQRLLSAYRRELPPAPARIIVGFSGGTDSLALALLLAAIQPAIPSRIELIHIDHVIRPESAEDAVACQRLAEAVHLPMHSVRLTAHPQQLYPGVGLEEAARRARYRVFSGVADEGDVVALAHQAGDQAETMLLHLMHGTGTSGLAGMRSVSRMQVPWWSNHEPTTTLTIWRPLLRERRSDLAQVVAHAGLEPLHDPTNDDLHLKRNAIRHVVLPALYSVEPTIDERLGTLARIASDEDALLQQIADTALAGALVAGNDLSAHEVAEAPIAIARRVLRRWLETAMATVPTFDRVDVVLELARSKDQSAVVEVGEGLVVGCFGEALRCGTLRHLRYRAWWDARLALPLANSGTVTHIAVSGDTIRVDDPFEACGPVQRALDSDGAIDVRAARPASHGFGDDAWNDWFRRERLSPWIRDFVQGVAIDGVLWWIPRLGDYDEPDSGRLVRVVWSKQEQR